MLKSVKYYYSYMYGYRNKDKWTYITNYSYIYE